MSAKDIKLFILAIIKLLMNYVAELVNRLPHWTKVYNGSFRVWLLNELLIVITKPEDIQVQIKISSN